MSAVCRYPGNREWQGVVALLVLTLLARPCLADVNTELLYDPETALATSQAAIGRMIYERQWASSTTFTTPDGRVLALSGFAGKPLVISFIYTSCHHICPTTTKHLYKAVRKARSALGTNAFSVLTIGFDVQRDTPTMMGYFSDKLGINEAGWSFASADTKAIADLAEATGFLFYPSPSGFDHLLQTTILDAEGRVYRQVYGLDFDTPALVEPLKQLVFNSPTASLVERLADQVRLFCTVYDPSQDKYRFDYSLFIGMFISFCCVGLLGRVLVKEWRVSLRNNL